MDLTTVTSSSSEEYFFVERLLVETFPSDEYRELAQLRHFTENNPLFTLYKITDLGEDAGFISIWDFQEFRYVEHFAVLPSMRNLRLGSRVLERLDRMSDKPIVLEVEEPVDDITRRRIGFYERNGFRLMDGDYLQPPYKPGSASLPMRIMTKGATTIATKSNVGSPESAALGHNDNNDSLSLEKIKETLYRYVYGT